MRPSAHRSAEIGNDRAVFWWNVTVTDELVSVGEVLDDADRLLAEGKQAAPRVMPTGFPGLDTYLGGGLRAGELCLLGGPQGLGKTALVLQISRNVVSRGASAVILSYEHDSTTLLERLVAVEAGEWMGLDGLPLRRVREALEASGLARGTLDERLVSAPGGADAVAALREYGDRLLLHRSSGTRTDIEAVRAVLRGAIDRTGRRPLVVVDYLQKVHVPGTAPEDERVAVVVEGLKDLALEYEVPVLAVVAADKEGLAAGRRLRVQHLRGSSSLAYEADVVLIMNEKYDVVARHHLVYDARNAERFRGYVVVSIEKNRSGLDRIDLQLRKRLEQSRFDTDVEPVPEELVDERVFPD
jgi:replicative DNA helicase